MKIGQSFTPPGAPADIIAWADTCGIRVDGHSFDSARTPQIIEPMRAMIDPETRIGTFIKPVQSGGSTAAEVVMGFWARFFYGLVQFNWQDDQKAKERWESRIRTLFDCIKGMRWAGDRFDETICRARFVNSTVYCQGVRADGALDSETVPFQINEEVHLWSPGMLDKARRRQTLVWNSKAFDVSNASSEGDQLHAAHEEGTMEVWEMFCPGCNGYHEMRFRWDDKHPELGGLRFDTGAGRAENGKYNFNRLVPTIRYQMPCGFIINDTAKERRLPGRYRKTNDGALSYKRSWTYEGVSVPEIKWPELVSEWLKADRASKTGDIEPMRRFVTERECRFWNPEIHRPFSGKLVVTQGRKLNRTGLAGEAVKFWAADWQQGYKHLGELTHYWLAIESVLPNCTSQPIFADKVSDEAEMMIVLKDHGITDDDGGGIADGFIDASKNTKHILSFCFRAGINAVVGGDQGMRGFRWPDGSWQYYSTKKYIWKELNMPEPKYPLVATREGWIEDAAEPYIIRYNKAGLLKNHFFIREMKANVLAAMPNATPDHYIERIIPEDIGEDYIKHMSAWERDTSAKGPRKMGEVEGFRQIAKADHLMSCTTYIDLMKDLTDLLPNQLAVMGIKTT